MFPLSCPQRYLLIGRVASPGVGDYWEKAPRPAPVPDSQDEWGSGSGECPARTGQGEEQRFLPPRRRRRTGGEGGQGLCCDSLLAVKLSPLAPVPPGQLPQDGKEEKEGAPRDSETLPKAEGPEEGGQPL